MNGQMCGPVFKSEYISTLSTIKIKKKKKQHQHNTCFSVKLSLLENMTTVLCMAFSSSSLTTYGVSIVVICTSGENDTKSVIIKSKTAASYHLQVDHQYSININNENLHNEHINHCHLLFTPAESIFRDIEEMAFRYATFSTTWN